ncbi:hypothetical protein [Nitrosococcus halophilus]|uniref:hypothetical protein n=1 Tax=Nitrosococcus halophilus TaxID=133539 RepID=UPI0012FF476B|nr:hypothetical protein [Nitrosococcus halophilus]
MSGLLAVDGPIFFRPPWAASEARPGARLAPTRTRLKPFRADAANTEPAGRLSEKWQRGTGLSAPRPEAAPTPVARPGLSTAPLWPFCGADLQILIPTANMK